MPNSFFATLYKENLMEVIMRLFLPIYFFIVTSAFCSNPAEDKCEELVEQQKSFHRLEVGPYRESVLNEWRSILSEQHKPQKTYLFWADSKADSYWFRSFLSNLKQDLWLLGLVLDDRMQNKKDKPMDFKDTAPVMAAERVVLLMTGDLSLTPSGHNWRSCYPELELISNRLRAVSQHIPDNPLILKSGSVLPIHLSGYNIGLSQFAADGEGAVLKTEEISSYSYLKLLIRLAKFIYNTPADLDFYSESLKIINGVHPELK